VRMLSGMRSFASFSTSRQARRLSSASWHADLEGAKDFGGGCLKVVGLQQLAAAATGKGG
jgi:hypothetical protein